jgi:flavin-dependent dehydrogenase
VDRDYEKERFSRNLLRESALHMERKHGFRIWSDAVDSWLASRHRELSLNADEVLLILSFTLQSIQVNRGLL